MRNDARGTRRKEREARVLDLTTARRRRAAERATAASGEPSWRQRFTPEAAAEIAALIRDLATECAALGAEVRELAALLAPAKER